MTNTSPALCVPRARWRDAQRFELNVWQRRHRWWRRSLARWAQRLRIRGHAYDDWNFWWSQQFEEYQLIPRALRNVIELGCGPYTNVRLILEGRTAEHVVCSDPLARHYVRFPGCWLEQRFSRGEILLDDHRIEECPFRDAFFDLVILINVLDHVQDARLCIDTAIRITRPGGQLVIGQDLTDADDAARVPEDIGHPIRLHHADIDRCIEGKVKHQFHRILPREKGRNPRAHYGTYLLIGERLPALSGLA